MTKQEHIDRLTIGRKLQDFGVTTLRQSMALVALDYSPRITVTEMSKAINTKSRASCRQLLVQLKDKGLVLFQSRESGHKGTIFSLTAKGAKAVDLILK